VGGRFVENFTGVSGRGAEGHFTTVVHSPPRKMEITEGPVVFPRPFRKRRFRGKPEAAFSGPWGGRVGAGRGTGGFSGVASSFLAIIEF